MRKGASASSGLCRIAKSYRVRTRFFCGAAAPFEILPGDLDDERPVALGTSLAAIVATLRICHFLYRLNCTRKSGDWNRLNRCRLSRSYRLARLRPK